MISKVRLVIIRGLMLSLLGIYSLTPLSVYAEGACTPPDINQPGVHVPTGADSGLFVYNCDSGLWESAHYIFDPLVGFRVPKDPVIYTYNPTSGLYDFTTWSYNAPNAVYVPYNQSVTQPPYGAYVIGAPAPVETISNTGANSNNTIDNGGLGGNSTINGTGSSSNNSISGSGQGILGVNNQNNLSIANLLNQTANSGEAMVLQNTNAGDATSGNAQDMATVVNILQSASNTLGTGNVVTFVQNINGDVNGDLLFDPAAMGSVPTATSFLAGNNDLTFNNSTNAAINNDINLTANTGNATVSENTTAGNATSGNAKVVANVVNLINSAVSSGQSFIGTININGNLNGDILLPPNLVDQLIAANVPTVTISNTGANSNNTINDSAVNSLTATNTNDQGITNNIKAGATTGTANVSQNTTAGNATSGNASNSITAFNLTGSSILGSNAILVFVNVTGQWVGLIVNAPAGAHAAALGGGISQTGPDSNNAINNGPGSNSATINNDNNQTITNNINVNAASGDANVTRNTNAGNAKTGDATTAVNLLNVENSSLSLTNWFGILFINVFGTWNGSFGVNTSAGDPIFAAPGVASGNNPKPFDFVPGGVGPGNKYYIKPAAFADGAGSGAGSNSNTFGAVLASTKGGSSQPGTGASAGVQHTNWGLIAASGSLFFIYLAGDYAYSAFTSRRTAAATSAITTTSTN